MAAGSGTARPTGILRSMASVSTGSSPTRCNGLSRRSARPARPTCRAPCGRACRPGCATGRTKSSRSMLSSAITSPARARTGSPSAPRSVFLSKEGSPRASARAICKTTKRTSREVALPEYVTIERGLGPEGRIAVVRFDRGDGINAMSPEALRQLTNAARSFEDDSDTSVVVLTGGAKAFSAGFDLKDAEGRSRRTMDIGSLRRHLKLGPQLTRAWQEMEQITIGAIEGFCIGGGVALAVALDFRVMARDAHLRVPEMGLGMNMSGESVPRMLHLMGPARTKQAVILADHRITAAEAYEWRLVEEVAEPGKAFDAAMALAAKVAAQPPLSVAMTKLTVNRLAHALDDLASHMDVDQFALASMSEDHREGVEAFLDRRKPRFRGR